MTQSEFNFQKQIEAYVLQKTTPYTADDIAYVNQYTGFGGAWSFDDTLPKERGLYEYYTPVDIIAKMVGMAQHFGFKGGKVGEPSCGIGRFLHYFAPEADVVGIELDEVSYKIAKANFPTFDIRHQSFNELFTDRRGNAVPYKAEFSLIIGNPPYGAFAGKGTTREKEITKADTYVDYFITRGLDLLVSGGLLVFIVPSAFLDSSQDRAVIKEILNKSTLLDAYRLPKGIFDQTDVLTDIVVFRKK